MAQSGEVREFYDQFTRSRLSTYRQGSNLRIEKAIARILDHVQRHSRVLEVGCGTGLVTKRIGDKASDGEVWACDISPEAINQAKINAASKNVHFKVIDIVEVGEDFKAWIPASLHLVVMVDVLEHIPIQRHQELFATIDTVLDDNGMVVLTYPSPMYQEYLQSTKPEELQIIDESITAAHILDVANTHGLEVIHYSLEDVWMTNQYVHCVLAKRPSLYNIDSSPSGVGHWSRSLASRLPDPIKSQVKTIAKHVVR